MKVSEMKVLPKPISSSNNLHLYIFQLLQFHAENYCLAGRQKKEKEILLIHESL